MYEKVFPLLKPLNTQFCMFVYVVIWFMAYNGFNEEFFKISKEKISGKNTSATTAAGRVDGC